MSITLKHVRRLYVLVYKRDPPRSSALWNIPRDVSTRARKTLLFSLLNWDRAKTVKTATIGGNYNGGNTLFLKENNLQIVPMYI